MTSPRVNAVGQRRASRDADTKAQKETLDLVKHMRLLKAARQLVVQWRREATGAYRIPTGARLALLQAVDESWDVLKGVME